MIGLITLDRKQTGERSAGKPHAAFDVAGAGNVAMAAGLRATAKAVETSPEPKVCAPVLDPTCERPRGKYPWPTHRILHCRSEAEANWLREQLATRLRDCGLEMHPEKTRVVYCKDSRRTGTHECVAFNFLGYTFRPRRIVDRRGQVRTGFTPAVSRAAMTAMRQAMRRWHLPLRSELSLGDLARMTASRVRGWIRYYCRFRGSEFQPVAEYIDRVIVRWAMRKYKRLRGHKARAFAWLGRVRRRYPRLFVHWSARGAFSVEAMGAR